MTKTTTRYTFTFAEFDRQGPLMMRTGRIQEMNVPVNSAAWAAYAMRNARHCHGIDGSSQSEVVINEQGIIVYPFGIDCSETCWMAQQELL